VLQATTQLWNSTLVMMIVSCGQIPRKCPTHCILISRFHTGFRQNPHRSTCNGPNTLDFFHINQLYLNKSCKRRLQLSDTLVASSAGFDENKDGDGYDKKQRVQVDFQLPRRRKLVSFTCNLCGMSSFRVISMFTLLANTIEEVFNA
jgi:hypothetical protein